MRKRKENLKGAKAIGEYGLSAINEECKTCIYYCSKRTCKGRLDLLIPCLYATKEILS